MAKAASIKIKMVSSADTGYYYVAKKNSRTKTDKLVKKKYDPSGLFFVHNGVGSEEWSADGFTRLAGK